MRRRRTPHQRQRQRQPQPQPRLQQPHLERQRSGARCTVAALARAAAAVPHLRWIAWRRERACATSSQRLGATDFASDQAGDNERTCLAGAVLRGQGDTNERV
eukprot:scaffold24198_cov73-Phaeocystis_antarctica.AAC.4